MSTFQALILAITFATLVVAILKFAHDMTQTKK